MMNDEKVKVECLNRYRLCEERSDVAISLLLTNVEWDFIKLFGKIVQIATPAKAGSQNQCIVIP